MIKVALDAMGGDHAPAQIIKGAIEAVNQLNVHVILVGDESVIKKQLDEDHKNISIVHANESILMDESPLQAYRKKKESSIHVGLQLVKDKKAQAFVSAGNTGAVMSCSLFILGRIPGVDRPALASVIPTKKGHALMLDMGSNVDSKPIHLEQYAVMGNIPTALMHAENKKMIKDIKTLNQLFR